MKKIITLALALCMLLSLATVTSFAAQVNTEDEVDVGLTVKSVTSTSTASNVDIPTDKKNLVDGVISPDDMGDKTASSYNYCANYVHINGSTLTIELEAENAADISGLRFYSRRTDGTGAQDIRPADNVGKAYVSLSSDGENYVTTDLLTASASSDKRYVDLKLAFAGAESSVSGVKNIKIEITQFFGGANQQHFGVEEVTLLNAGEEKKTVAEAAAVQFKNYVTQIPAYPVHGGLERKNLLAQAENALAVAGADVSSSSDEYTSYTGYKEKYSNATVKELEADLTVTSNKAYATDGTVRKTCATAALTDGVVSKITEGVDAYAYMVQGNYAFEAEKGETTVPSHMIIDLKINPEDTFSGIRIYGRRRDLDKTTKAAQAYQTDALVATAEVTLYDENDNVIAIVPVTAKMANTTNDQTINSTITTAGNEPVFADLRIADDDAAVTGIARAEIKITALYNNWGHFGSEEIRLTGCADETEMDAETLLVQNATAAINAIAEYPVYTGLERQQLIAEAKPYVESVNALGISSMTDLITAYNDYKSKLDNAKVKEIKSGIKAKSIIAYATDGSVRSDYGNNIITDGKVNKGSDTRDYNTFKGADYAFLVDTRPAASEAMKKTPSHLTITLTGDSAAKFTGIRFYSRKSESTSGAYQVTAMPYKTEITLKNEDGTSVTYNVTGKTSVKDTDSDMNNTYADLMIFPAGDYAATGITEIEIKISSLTSNGSHFGSEEIRLIDANDSTAVDDINELAYRLMVNDIGRYTVHGGLEREKAIPAAETAYDELSSTQQNNVADAKAKFDTYKENYNAATVHEVETTLSAESVKAYLADGSLNSIASGNGDLGTAYITDGVVTDKYTNGNNPMLTFLRGDWAMHKVTGKDSNNNDIKTYSPNDNSIVIKLTADTGAEFSGIRFYARKTDNGTWYNGDSRPGTAEITLKDEDGNILSLGNLTAVQSGTSAGQTDVTNNYADFSFSIGGAIKAVKGVKTIEIKINSLAQVGHFGCEEIRLLMHDDASKAAALSDVLKGRVQLSAPTVSAEVTTAGTAKTGTVRFVTSFASIDSAAELTEFGTYVIDLDKFTAGGSTIGTDAVYASYKKADNEFTADAVSAGTTFAVDVVNIPESGFTRKYAAISFAKIAGYDQMITSAACQTAGNELSE